MFSDDVANPTIQSLSELFVLDGERRINREFGVSVAKMSKMVTGGLLAI